MDVIRQTLFSERYEQIFAVPSTPGRCSPNIVRRKLRANICRSVHTWTLFAKHCSANVTSKYLPFRPHLDVVRQTLLSERYEQIFAVPSTPGRCSPNIVQRTLRANICRSVHTLTLFAKHCSANVTSKYLPFRPHLDIVFTVFDTVRCFLPNMIVLSMCTASLSVR